MSDGIHFDNLPLKEVVDYLGNNVDGVNFVVHPDVAQVPISLKLNSVTLDDIFTAIEICTRNSAGPIDAATGLPMAVGAVKITKVNERMVSFTVGDASAAAA